MPEDKMTNEQLLKELMGTDEFDLLVDDAESIFNLKHVKHSSERLSKTKPVHVERSVVNEDHDADMFAVIKEQMKTTHQLLYIANPSKVVQKGVVIVLNGITGVITSTGIVSDEDPQERIEVVFSNRTKSNMYRASMVSALSRDTLSRVMVKQ